MAGHQRRFAALLLKVVGQHRLDNEKSGLGVAGVVEIIRSISCATLALADRQQVAPQQLGGHGETLPGAIDAEQCFSHAHLL